MIFSSKTGASVPRPLLIDSNEDCEMDFKHHNDNMDQDIPARQFPTALSGTIAQFLNGMPDWMNMTPEDINLAVESLPNPSEGHILPGILLQEAKEANERHHTHDRHYQIITLNSYVYTILVLYTYHDIVYDIVFDIDEIIDIEFVHSTSRGLNQYQIISHIDIEAITSISKLQLGVPRAYWGVHTLIVGSTRLLYIEE
jgi:hypothetical protein